MAKTRRPIFRESAMKQYLQKREQDILPNTVSPPFFTYGWLVVLLLVVAGTLAWSSEVPTFMTASGVITAQTANSNAAQAILFIPTQQATKVKAGEVVQLKLGANGPTRITKIVSVRPGVVSPTDARKLFALDNGAAQVITEPSVIVTVGLDQSISTQTFAGTTVNAQVQIGSHSVLSEFTLN